MRRLAIAVSVLATLLAAMPVLAAQRTFVRSDGSDGNPCSLAQPCRGFAAAAALTDPNGEIVVLDSAGYGSVTLTQAVSIIASPGVYAGISVFGGQDGVTINAAATDRIVLSGLSINGQGGARGIVVTAGGRTHIENCVIANMGSDGIQVNGGTSIYVSNSEMRSNGSNGLNLTGGTPAPEVHVYDSRAVNNINAGIFVSASSSLTLERTSLDNNFLSGLQVNPGAAATIRVAVRDSQFSGNGGSGVVAFANVAGATVHVSVAGSNSVRNAGNGYRADTSGGTVAFVVSQSTANNNSQNGMTASGAGAIMSVSGSTSSQNSFNGLSQAGSAQLRSHGNNAVNGNAGAETAGTITNVGLM